MFHVEDFALSNFYFFRPLVKFPLENDLRKLAVNAELLEFVIKRRNANHPWRPSSKAAPKQRQYAQRNQRLLINQHFRSPFHGLPLPDPSQLSQNCYEADDQRNRRVLLSTFLCAPVFFITFLLRRFLRFLPITVSPCAPAIDCSSYVDCRL